MKLSYQWIQQYLDLNVPADQLAENIERTAVEYDGVDYPSAGMKKIIVGKIIKVDAHPDSDHLNICQVDIGEDEPIQIVCGAPNVQNNQKAIVALHGARLKDNTKIKRSKIRGVRSNGMLCALDEIGFDKKVIPDEWSDGIYFLPEDAKIGESVFPYLGMDDQIIDLDVTPNRGDMLSIYGAVHELAAMYNLTPKLDHPNLQENVEVNTKNQINANADEKITPIYNLRVINDVNIKPSPLWLQIKLWNSGIKPVNNIKDTINYIMVKYGIPLQVFDLDKIQGHKLNVRFASDDEKFKDQKDNEYDLNNNDIVVSDNKGPIALAGVATGKNAEINNGTKNIVIEASDVTSTLVRKMAQKHNIHTESSQRFERGIDRTVINEASDAASELINQLANGKIASGNLEINQEELNDVQIKTNLNKINAVLGTDLSESTVQNIFERLGFGVQVNDKKFIVSVPPRRWDIHIDADLFEEVARIYGYENLPSTLPAGSTTIGALTNKQKIIRYTRQQMERLGLTHALSYSLTTNEKAKLFMLNNSYETHLAFPMSKDHETLRMNLISGLLDDIAYNQARNVNNVALYEQGRVFYKDNEDQVRPDEIEHIAGAVSGTLKSTNWNAKGTEIDFYQLKGIVNSYLNRLNVEGDIKYVANDDRKQMHPGRTADIYIHDHFVGFIGQVHPLVTKQFKINDTYVFELNLQKLIEMPKKDQQYVQISKYPAISRDIAILVDKTVNNQQILDTINQNSGKYLESVKLFDIYEGEHIPNDKKSMAYTLVYRDKQHTLVEDVVDKAFNKVQKALINNYNVQIR